MFSNTWDPELPSHTSKSVHVPTPLGYLGMRNSQTLGPKMAKNLAPKVSTFDPSLGPNGKSSASPWGPAWHLTC
ncbi:hypothetical protein WN48_09896 [Eufriesea mexicana]|nr:hypothetical protein WN48_09896 [Eufriesea mexicana]